MKKILIIVLVFMAGVLSVLQAAERGYKLVNTIRLSGDSGWDYLYADGEGRLYVSHGDMVQVIDCKKRKQIGEIKGVNGVHGIAVDQASGTGFISCGKDDAVAVFDLKTMKVTKTIKTTGGNPDAIIYDGFSGKVFTFNGKSSNSTVMDAKTLAVTATIALEGKPEYPAADGKGKIYVNIEDKSEIAVINTVDLKAEEIWPLSPGKEPTGMAIDTAGGRIFLVCHNNLMVVIDTSNGRILAKLPIGSRVDGAGFDPGLKRSYSSNGEGTLTVVQESGTSEFRVIDTVDTTKGARTMAVDPSTHHIYLSVAGVKEEKKENGAQQKG